VFAALYLLALLSLAVCSQLVRGPSARQWFALVLGVIVGTQLVFLLGAGTIELCRPIRKRRLLLPILIASGLMTLLVAGCAVAMLELCKAKNFPQPKWLWIAFVWLVWGIIFFLYCRKLERWRVLKRLIQILLAGSLLDLLATVPAHLVVIRRPGCLVGLGTGAGIAAGICAMFWAFGPGIALLFFRERYQAERQRNEIEGEGASSGLPLSRAAFPVIPSHNKDR
jgi:hypothetical protein